MNDMNCRSGPAVKKPKITPSTPLLPSFEGSQRLPERQTGRNWNASSAKSIPIEHPFSSVVPCRESCRYYLGFDRILRKRRRGDHGRTILKKWEIREPGNQRWEKNEPTINLYRPRGMNPVVDQRRTDRLPGISGGDTGFRIGNRPGFGRRGRPPAVLGPQTRAGKSQVAMRFM